MVSIQQQQLQQRSSTAGGSCVTEFCQWKRLALFTAVGFLVIVFVSTTTGTTNKAPVEEKTKVVQSKTKDDDDIHTKWKDCTVGPISTPDSAVGAIKSNLKPFWSPTYPHSDQGVVSTLVTYMTPDYKHPAKSYYSSTPTMKKCFSTAEQPTVTVICGQIHPIVSIGNGPIKHVDKFQSKILMTLRNPMTNIPAHFQAKAEMYHGATGQLSIEEWRSTRDEWLERTAVHEWTSVLTTWKNMTEYDGIAMYLPYEDLIDPIQGPEITRRLATILQQAGFAVVSPTNEHDIHCVWYNSVKDRIQAKYPLYEYATDYIPQYTLHQKQYMIQQIVQLQKLYPQDIELLTILNRYIVDIQNNTVNDQRAS